MGLLFGVFLLVFCLGRGDFKHIFDFQKASKKEVIGIVFYMGDHVIEIDEQNFAVPFGMFF
jgi:hypothetical protein